MPLAFQRIQRLGEQLVHVVELAALNLLAHALLGFRRTDFDLQKVKPALKITPLSRFELSAAAACQQGTNLKKPVALPAEQTS